MRMKGNARKAAEILVLTNGECTGITTITGRLKWQLDAAVKRSMKADNIYVDWITSFVSWPVI